jgi:hypothetical protein
MHGARIFLKQQKLYGALNLAAIYELTRILGVILDDDACPGPQRPPCAALQHPRRGSSVCSPRAL